MAGFLLIQESPDNSNFDKETRFNFDPTRQNYIDTTIKLSARYVKITYTNGGTSQASFRLATTYHTNKAAVDTAQTIQFPTGSLDGFQRIITCSPVTNVDVHRVLGLNNLSIINYVAGTGATITHNADQASATLSLASGATAGSMCTSRSRARIIYQPSKVIDTIMTGVLAANITETNVVSRMGLFDANSGVFISSQSTGDAIGHRTRVSGSVVDTLIARADWNGQSQNFTLDTTKANIYNFRHAWLGVSSVQVAVLAHGHRHILHTFFFENVRTAVFQLTGSLPLSWELERTSGTSTAAASTVAICGSISSLAGATPSGKSYTINRGRDAISITSTETAILAISLVASDYALECVQAAIRAVSVICTSNAHVLIQLRLFHDTTDTTALPSVSWSTAGADSGVQYSTAATTLNTTGSTVLTSAYFTETSDSITVKLDESARLAYNALNGLSDIMVVTAQVVVGGSETISCALDFTSYI